MKSHPHLLLILLLGLGSCGERESGDVASDPSAANDVAASFNDPIPRFLEKVGNDGQVVFQSWNGELRGMDSDAILYFRKDSMVELEDRGLGVEYYDGSYRFGPGGKVEISLLGYREAWPAMMLHQEGGTFLLFREDGETSWAAGHPDPEAVAGMDGFWPFRALK